MKYETDEKCGQCGGKLIFDHTNTLEHIVKWSPGRYEAPDIIRNTKMPFVWVYFKCEDCDYGLCCASDSDSIKKPHFLKKFLSLFYAKLAGYSVEE